MAVTRSDLEIQREALDSLRSDVRLDVTHLSVDVGGGIVYLRGSVPTVWQRRIARDVANRLKGVVDVVNELRVIPPARRPDDEVAADVRAALVRDSWVDERKVAVQVANGVVYLSGVVDSYVEKSYVASDAWSVPGVVDVVDNVVIAPQAVRSDAEIADDVRAALGRNVRVDPSRIEVAVTNAVVYLRGTVDTAEKKWLGEDVAWWTIGVRDVVNELTVSL